MTRTSTLYATPSFLRGAAALLDLGSTLTQYNYSESPEQADYNAIQNDWIVVGEDIRSAMHKWERENE